VAFIATLMDGKVDFVCCDFPTANRLTLHILAAVAEHEREMIAKRTKDGLAAAKAKGVVLGNPNLAAANRAGAIERAKALAPIFVECQGMSARQIAAELNKRKVATPTGAPWSAKTVIRARERLAVQFTSSDRRLGPRHNRPRSRRAAEKRDELAALQDCLPSLRTEA
jgi:DNA invertase Pin-like site-specific DNA recombinase